MPPSPPPISPSRGQLALLAFVAFHVLTAAGSMLNGTAVGDGIRTLTRAYERGVGVYQGWPMFAPNAPTGTFWLEVVAYDGSGTELQRWPLYGGEVHRSGVMLGYDRLHKLERTLGKSNRQPGRDALLERECARSRGDPDLAATVTLTMEERGRRRGGSSSPDTWTSKEAEVVGSMRCAP